MSAFPGDFKQVSAAVEWAQAAANVRRTLDSEDFGHELHEAGEQIMQALEISDELAGAVCRAVREAYIERMADRDVFQDTQRIFADQAAQRVLDDQRNLLARRAALQNSRRFSAEPEALTGWGGL